MTAYLCLAVIYFISTLDINSVATALPAISRSLNAGSSITWAGTAYLMGQTCFQALYGRLSDIFGRKPVLLASIACLIIGDILCGFAQNITWLYVCRSLSGVGGGGISSLVQITVSDLVSLRERGKYQGMLSGAIGLGAGAGPFLAAAFINGDKANGESWRWIFWVPPILAAACLFIMLVALPLKPVTGSWREKLAKIDWLGLFAAVTAVVLVLVPINSGGSIFPWNSALVISMLSIGGFAFVVLAVIEQRFARIPIVPLRLFTQTPTAVIMLQSALYNSVWQVDIYFLPIYFQQVRGYSALQSAALVLPLLLLQSLAGIASGPIMRKQARYGPVLYMGMALWTLGAGLKIIFSLNTSVAVYAVVLAIEGIGIGFVLQPALVALQALSRKEDRAVATSVRNLMRMLGSVFGMASSTAIKYAVTQAALPAGMPLTVQSKVLSGTWERGDPADLEWENEILDAEMRGIRAVFIMLAPLVAICLLGCYFVPDTVLNGDEKKDDPTENHQTEGVIQDTHAKV
ncbi:putative major facilitator superfamily transporter protein [Phaeoacremonium minimum UCRPA7]|uniref:Putative major facilitator superfamily transporter protein n=1 Tax=Phaeoacremonium minimum (strain UCR-PA7) TaxID=1286976 RepID=R8BH93_PHAM7|nr:putative major facilitator superfamily transporter protein [Phaeoacremonium minimum UCRPA7]EON98671.1 putative major facilitator superfamily transporter protein [Phaeoacremonium minimum UCRPA7]